MAYFRRAVLAVALAGAGLAGGTGAAFANEDHHHDDTTEQSGGVANVSDTQTVVPTDVCGNNVPINALGVQVPVQDATANVPVLSGSDDNGTNGSGVEKSCGSRVDTDS